MAKRSTDAIWVKPETKRILEAYHALKNPGLPLRVTVEQFLDERLADFKAAIEKAVA